jgi:hypothetical protein
MSASLGAADGITGLFLSVVSDIKGTVAQQKDPGKTGAFEISKSRADQRE